MTSITSARQLAAQYGNAANLNARIALHQRFSTNPCGWHRWAFDQLALPAGGRILELGCGPGALWQANRDRTPEGWEVILSDLSAGMLDEARAVLGRERFAYARADAQAIPFPDERFDAVVAHHMLYHVPDRTRALAEVRRVLVPGGRLYAATNGPRHMMELRELAIGFDPALTEHIGFFFENTFLLEGGAVEIAGTFADVSVRRYPDALEVNEVAPLVEYVLSGRSGPALAGERVAEFTAYVEREMRARGGVVHITKDAGIIVGLRC